MHAIQPAATCREGKRHFLSCDLHSACSGLRRQRACEYFISGEADAIAHTSELAFVKQASSGHVLVPVRSPPHPSTQRSKSPVVFRARSFESHGEAASGASTLPGQLQTANCKLQTGDWRLETLTHAVRRAIWCSSRWYCCKHISSPLYCRIAKPVLTPTTIQQTRQHFGIPVPMLSNTTNRRDHAHLP
jgi:hypothetical protein